MLLSGRGRKMVSQDLIDKIKLEISKGPVNYRYFFDKLNSTDWIDPLTEAGFFHTPPEIEKKGEYLTFPDWPESRYLSRMASKDPDKVFNVLIKLPETDNPQIHEDIVDAALEFPPDLANLLSEKEVHWVKNQKWIYRLLPEKYIALIKYLSKDEENGLPFQLAKALLSFSPDPDYTELSEIDDLTLPEKFVKSKPEPKTKVDDWHYSKILRETQPFLFHCSEDKYFSLLVNLLHDFINLSLSKKAKEHHKDLSYIWRPAIEDHSQNYERNSAKETLVTIIRDTSVQIIENDIAKLKPLMEDLEKRKYTIFRRIALYLLQLFAKQAPNLVEERLLSKENYESVDIYHEYYSLLKHGYRLLSPTGKETILNWIQETSSAEAIKKLDQALGLSHTEEELLISSKYRKLKKLYPIHQDLDSQWQAIYASLLEELGEPEHPDFLSWHSAVRTGPESPKSFDELSSMSVNQVFDFLKTWEAPKDFMAPSPEGLARVLASAIAKNPAAYTAQAHLFRELEPTYVRALIDGTQDSIPNHYKDINWANIFELCQWVIVQPDEQLKQEYSPERDMNWRSARQSIARFVSKALERNSETKEEWLPLSFRENIWNIIQMLAEDPEPTEDYEERSTSDPITICINTIRGVAIEAAICYGLWVKRQSIEANNREQIDKFRFDGMPELKLLLEQHLDLSIEKSLAIRAIYGQLLENLLYLDYHWTKDNVNNIFPMSPEHYPLFEAGWETYLAFNNPRLETFDILKAQFQFATENVDKPMSNRSHIKDYREALGEYLSIFYWDSIIEYDPKSLIGLFFSKASGSLRGETVEFMGRELIASCNTDQLSRLEVFFEDRLCKAKEKPDDFIEELSSFSWWFRNARIDVDWFLKRLEDILNTTRKLDSSWLISEKLEKLYPDYPLQVLACLSLMIHKNESEWGLFDISKNTESILEKALRSTEDSIQQKAKEIANYLLAKGHMDIRKIMSPG
jgi:hypothetical protein